MRAAGLVLALLACLVGPDATLGIARFGDAASTTATFDTPACFPGEGSPPTIGGSVVGKTAPYLPGFVRQGGSYRVSATATAPCGLVAVRADVSALTSGASAVPLAAGPVSEGGVTYTHRSGTLTVRNPLAEGTYAYMVTATDNDGSTTAAGFTVVVDNTRPDAADIQTENGGDTVGMAEMGDRVVYTFSEPIDPDSVLDGWTGEATAVIARITHNGPNDRLVIRHPTSGATLPLSTVMLNGDYVASTREFGASGTPSWMTLTGTTITVVFGTPSGATLGGATAGAMSWAPQSTATDRAGNACLTTSISESGVADVEF